MLALVLVHQHLHLVQAPDFLILPSQTFGYPHTIGVNCEPLKPATL
jgi:hypothetical protein